MNQVTFTDIYIYDTLHNYESEFQLNFKKKDNSKSIYIIYLSIFQIFFMYDVLNRFKLLSIEILYRKHTNEPIYLKQNIQSKILFNLYDHI